MKVIQVDGPWTYLEGAMTIAQHVNRGLRFLDRKLAKGRALRILDLRNEDSFRDSIGLDHASSIWYQQSSARDLKVLFDLYGSDKGSNGDTPTPYPWRPHTYADVYASLFGHCRGSVTAVFECGIGSNNEDVDSNMTRDGIPGASLRAWRDYFPNAQIVGADIDSRILFDDVRISTYQVDQTDPASVQALWAQAKPSSFDLMIDDGLHTFAAGVCLLEASFPRLKPGGIYVIEDVAMRDLQLYRTYFLAQDLWVTFILMPRTIGEPVGDNCLILIRSS